MFWESSRKLRNEWLKGNIMHKKRKKSRFRAVSDKNIPFAFKESYKAIRTNLEYATSAEKRNCILVTSTLPEEAKTTTALNLAITLAENGKRVVVVECDMRNPTIGGYVGIRDNVSGLIHYLTQSTVSKDLIREIERYNISVILSGGISQKPSELLHDIKMDVLFEFLKGQFDYVIVDAPPIAVVTDAAIIGQKTDGAILVVRSGFAPAKTIRREKKQLESVGINVLGVVLTRYDAKKAGWRSGYSYYRASKYSYGCGNSKGKS